MKYFASFNRWAALKGKNSLPREQFFAISVAPSLDAILGCCCFFFFFFFFFFVLFFFFFFCFCFF